MDLLKVYCTSWLKFFLLNSLGFPSQEASVWYSLLRTILYNIPSFDTLLWRIAFLHVVLSKAALLYTNFLPWQALAGTCPVLQISLLLRFGSSQNYSLLPSLEAEPQLPVQIPRCVQYCPNSSHQNISLVCENFINECVYYGFQHQKRSPIVLGTIQTFPVLDRFSSGWMQARTGVWGGGRMWHTNRIVVSESWCCDLSRKTFVCVWCLLGLF